MAQSPPPTLESLSHQAIGIDAQCDDCRDDLILGFERLLPRYADVEFPTFVRLLKCSACSSRRIDARPVWPTHNPIGYVVGERANATRHFEVRIMNGIPGTPSAQDTDDAAERKSVQRPPSRRRRSPAGSGRPSSGSSRIPAFRA